MDRGPGMDSGWLKHLAFTVHFTSIVITSAPPQIIRHWTPELGTPELEHLPFKGLSESCTVSFARQGWISTRDRGRQDCDWPYLSELASPAWVGIRRRDPQTQIGADFTGSWKRSSGRGWNGSKVFLYSQPALQSHHNNPWGLELGINVLPKAPLVVPVCGQYWQILLHKHPSSPSSDLSPSQSLNFFHYSLPWAVFIKDCLC